MMNKRRLIGSVVSAALCAVLWAPAGFAGTNHLKNDGYTRKEQISATKAINFGLTTVDILNAGLAKAYGANAVFIAPDHDNAKSGGSTLALTRKRGKRLIEQLAAYEPLTSVCSVDSGVYYLMHKLSVETAALLAKRALATAEESARWSREGNTLGMTRLGALNTLNCVPVRAAFNGSVLRLEDSFVLTRAALVPRDLLARTSLTSGARLRG